MGLESIVEAIAMSTCGVPTASGDMPEFVAQVVPGVPAAIGESTAAISQWRVGCRRRCSALREGQRRRRRQVRWRFRRQKRPIAALQSGRPRAAGGRRSTQTPEGSVSWRGWFELEPRRSFSAGDWTGVGHQFDSPVARGKNFAASPDELSRYDSVREPEARRRLLLPIPLHRL